MQEKVVGTSAAMNHHMLLQQMAFRGILTVYKNSKQEGN